MERQITHREAWADFYTWIRLPENWQRLNMEERNRIYNAQRDFQEVRQNAKGHVMRLGGSRIKDILTHYAPERYEFRSVVILIEP